MHIALILLLASAASAWFMTGLIWFVQIVHYPQFGRVGADSFASYHERHTSLTTWVVGPPMLVEALSAIGLLCFGGNIVQPALAWTDLLLVAVVWLSTALLQVPRHTILSNGWNEQAARFLCRTNWLRTIAWSARAALMLYAVARAFPPGA